MMGSLDDFNAEMLATFLEARLVERSRKLFRFYIHRWGNISIFENGGEVNVYFERLPDIEISLPQGVRADQFAFTFSIPYMCFSQRITEKEFAIRLKFYLERATTGVDEIHYFQQDTLSEPVQFIPKLSGKVQCDLSPYFPQGTPWQVLINSNYEFEV